MKEMEPLADLAPEDIPEASRFLLEINFTELSKYHPDTQKYWILAVNAALAAQNQEWARGARAKRVRGWVNTKIPSRQKLGMVAIEQQIQKDGMHQPPTSNNIAGHHTQPTIKPYVQKWTHPSAAMNLLKSNKRMRKPDQQPQIQAYCVRGYMLSLLLAFLSKLFTRQSDTNGVGVPIAVPNPAAPCNLAVVRHGNQKDFRLSQLYREQ